MGRTGNVIVCGSSGCGKTTLLEQLIYGGMTPNTEFLPTIEDIYVANIETEKGVKEKFRFYDIGGVELTKHNGEIPRHYFSFAEGFVLVYSVDNAASFAAVESLKVDIDRNKEKKEVTIIVLANKCDMASSNWKTNRIAAQTWASREKVRVFEVSTHDRRSLYEPFVYLAGKLIPSQNKSSFPQISMGRKAKD